MIPKNKRRKCIFHKSCSNHVYETTKSSGLIKGIQELIFRVKNCNSEFDIFTDLETGEKKMILKTGVIISESLIAERLK